MTTNVAKLIAEAAKLVAANQDERAKTARAYGIKEGRNG